MPSIESFRTVIAGDEGVIHGKQMKTFVNLGTMGTEAVAEMEETIAAKGVPMLDRRLRAACSGPGMRISRLSPPPTRRL